jgi:hypothetical protein
MNLIDKYLKEAVKFDKKSSYEFDHSFDGTTMKVYWDEKRKTWYGDNGKFDFDAKTVNDLKTKLKKWDYIL